MLVMFNFTEPVGGAHAMTEKQSKAGVINVKALLEDDDYLRAMVRVVVQAPLEAEMRAALGAEKGEPYPSLILDARSERVREAGVIRSQAVLGAIGVDREGRRNVLGVDLAPRESATSWKDFLQGLKARGLHGVEFVVRRSRGLKRASREVLPAAAWQRCYVGPLKKVHPTSSAPFELRMRVQQVQFGRGWLVRYSDQPNASAGPIGCGSGREERRQAA